MDEEGMMMFHQDTMVARMDCLVKLVAGMKETDTEGRDILTKGCKLILASLVLVDPNKYGDSNVTPLH